MLKQQLQSPGCMKVRLTYQSALPHTEAALTLQRLGVKHPYVEEVRVLVPSHEAFSDLKAYQGAFDRLKQDHVVPADSLLTGYAFDDADESILAYMISPGAE